jgi:hypothetical protein
MHAAGMLAYDQDGVLRSFVCTTATAILAMAGHMAASADVVAFHERCHKLILTTPLRSQILPTTPCHSEIMFETAQRCGIVQPHT